MRIVALAREGDQSAKIVFEKVIRPWHFVSLPHADLIVEMAPDMQIDEDLIAEILSAVGDHQHAEMGGVDANTGIQDLVFALFAAAVAVLVGYLAYAVSGSPPWILLAIGVTVIGVWVRAFGRPVNPV